jgi:hypothetical protein
MNTDKERTAFSYAPHGKAIGDSDYITRQGLLSARWAIDRQSWKALRRLSQTIGDKLSDQLPMYLWPKARVAYYCLASLEIGLLLLALFVPRPVAIGR